jgi:response regulator RpfG family c-di-GMP phosphodiesterase
MTENYVLQDEPSARKLLHTIFDYIPKIARERDLDRLLVLLADMGRDLVISDRCTVWLVDEEANILWSKVAHGVDRISIAKDHGIAGNVFMSGSPLVINDPYNDSRFDRHVDMKTGYKTKNIVALPIQASTGETIGVFQAVNKMTKTDKFSEEDVEHLLLAATYTGRQLEAALLQDEIEKTQKEIIFTLAETGEMRSKETGYHVKRVSEYSRLLGIKYGFDEIESQLLLSASPLHDIGKIAIPDEVLLKPGKLDPEERTLMETHSNLGFEMLKSSNRRILKSAAVIAHEHHEKWNGEGYPRGLKGDEIHIFGRIMAIADVFDALGSDRCYKKAWETDRILELFKSERGRHFDPDLTDIFLQNFDTFLLIRDANQDKFS